MSLSKQLIALVVGLVLVLFVGTFFINLQNTRGYLNAQLRSHAQDAATALGLSATTHMAGGDKAMVRSMADVVFDSGDYLQVRIEDMSGKPWVDRHADLRNVAVPRWFMEQVPLETPEGVATIMDGWRQVGMVKIRSHPGYAYEQLWRSARESLLWFLGSALVVSLLGALALRMMLRPLKAVEAQAEAICNREFPVVTGRPFTTEFRRVVEAMNRLASKVQRMLDESASLAEKLRQQAFTDPVTGLANKRHLLDALEHRVNDPDHLGSGVLLLIQLNEFKAYNQQAGYAAGDRLLQRCAEVLGEALPAHRRCLLAHTAGADFALLVEGIDVAGSQTLAEHCATAVAGLYSELSLPSADVVHVGGAMFHGQGVSEWLAEADMALRSAQRAGANQWQLQAGEESGTPTRSASDWRALLEQALGEGAWELVRQPVFRCPDRQLMHEEVFLRLPDPDRPGEMLSAGQFLPMAESVGLASQLDRAVLTRVMEQLAGDADGPRQAVNLSPASLRDPAFDSWLQERLAQQPEVAGRLILEFPEYGAMQAEGLADLVASFERLGVEVALDHFGLGFSSLAQIRLLKVHYLKLDGGLVRSLASDQDGRFFVQALSKIAHGLEMSVVADSVETADVWTVLEELGVDGGRGYWLGRPEAR